ncbi:DNA repair exonuclease [Vagococcus sp. DIV0080]|uniref:DNA repair exonuclease n=1 Tax=Candidatus Vagococcus giribetii TaxID=2230876 RepID=A0ABS3HTL2_9ENTE|nr:DNA repair exonuclease [Vagococcus sp. DIV0080]MBO0476996.1 DNA repair exonuclease [Vagococcus sp. DIV0080]
MKFIHTADLHIDQPFSGIHSDHADMKEILKTGNQQTLTRIVDLCIEKEVDFLLVVGDTFHQNQPSIHTQKFVMDQFERLNQANIKVVMSFGNHDYYTESRYWFEWPDNVVLYKKEEVQTKTLTLKNGDSVAISGFSYEHNWITDSKLPEFPRRDIASTYHIGFYHGDDTGNYAPFLPSDLPLNYEYWALGHIHKSGVLSERPLTVYPGTPQGHTKKETQTNGVAYVEIDRGGRHIEWLDVAAIKWYQETVQVDDDISKTSLLSHIETTVLEKDYLNELNVVSIHLVTTAENAREILHEKEEVLAFLQEKIYQASNKKVWVQELTIAKATSDKLIMGFQASLIDDLGRVYQTKENFEAVVSDLLNQPELVTSLKWDEEDMKDIVTESSQLIKDKMIFKNEED